MDILWTLIFFVISVLGCLYLVIRWNFGYWRRRGVPGPQPSVLGGNMQDSMLGKKNMGEVFTDLYFQTKSLPYCGMFMLFRSTLLVNDLELIKTMLVKDFVHFSDHNLKINDKANPLGAHLFNAVGEKWKNLRNKLTPTFTSSKIKYMFEVVAQCGKEMTRYLQENETQCNVYDVKDLLATFNTDVIGSCAFGIECNSFTNPDSEFRKMGRHLFEGGKLQSIVQFASFFIPKLVFKLGIRLFPKDIDDFFLNIVEKTIKHREENNIVRNDFMQLLIKLKNDGSIENNLGKGEVPVDDGTRLTAMQIAAQVFVFFIAGFETSSTTASFALYELALNPDIQDTLQKEIDEVLKKYEGKVTYEALGEMSYLTKVIEETLRKYPPVPILFRICTKEYTIPGTDTKIEKETPMIIPIMGIQRDPEIFPNPMKFDPERFTPENKAARHHFSYLPFGEGPRICIGNRFGMMQTRLGLVSVLSKYQVAVCDKTHIPMKFNIASGILAAEGGMWLKLNKRTI